MKPYLVQSVEDSEGNIVSQTEPELVRQVISEETSATVRKILEQVVGDQKEGTGHNAYVAGYRIGGKTGTSTKTTEEIAGNKEYIVSFIGFAPADDPEIAILVLLDDPQLRIRHLHFRRSDGRACGGEDDGGYSALSGLRAGVYGCGARKYRPVPFLKSPV